MRSGFVHVHESVVLAPGSWRLAPVFRFLSFQAMNEPSLRSGNDDKEPRVRIAFAVRRIVKEFLSPSSAGFGTMNSRLTALLFALFLCHEACADCFVVDVLEYDSPKVAQGHAYDTFCYRDTLAYYYSTEIGGGGTLFRQGQAKGRLARRLV